MRKSAAKRFVETLERELGLHREMLELVTESAEPDKAGPAPPLGLTGSLCFAARLRDVLTSSVPEVESSGEVFGALDSLPADEAARVAELRREFEAVLAALSAKKGAPPGPADLPV